MCLSDRRRRRVLRFNVDIDAAVIAATLTPEDR